MLTSPVILFIFSLLTLSTVVAENDPNIPTQEADCVLPPYPENGRYALKNNPTAKPGEKYPHAKLDVSCDTGFKSNIISIFCVEGEWSAAMPTCVQCGKVSPHDHSLTTYERSSAQLPWHVSIYSKKFKPYLQLCSGSLISPTIVISAANCFWNDVRKILPASNFAVAVGNIYRPYNDTSNRNSQQSDVVEIKIPLRFRGAAANYQDDISVVIVGTPFSFTASVRPVCLNFDNNFNRVQLEDGKLGKAGSWSIAGKRSNILNVVDLQYMNIDDCPNMSPPSFRQYLTSDKFCAGSNDGKLLCKGDTGSGYAFLDPKTERYYLRGVVSVGPATDDNCPNFTTFTSIVKHEHFIKQHIYVV